MIRTSIKTGSFFFIGVCALVFVLVPQSASAACDFTRNLDLGDEGEDVRCLQKYLNGAGFAVAESGVGSPGHETTQFKTLTQQAVAKWQTANALSPAIGYFGPLSREKYGQLTTGGGTTPPVTSGSGDPALVSSLTAQLATLQNELNTLKSQPAPSAEDKKARDALKKAITMILEAEDQIDDPGEGADIANAESNLDDAKEDFLDAVNLFLKNNYSSAITKSDDAYNNAVDAFEDAGGETEEDQTEEILDEVDDLIEEVEKAIDQAGDNGEDVDEAEALLKKAIAKLDAAEEALDNGDISEAEALAEDAEDLADDARDAIGENSEREDAEDAIDDAQDAIADARDEIEEADDDGKDTDDAEEYLEDAEDKLDDAQDEFDDENYDDATDLAQEAENLAKDAINEV